MLQDAFIRGKEWRRWFIRQALRCSGIKQCMHVVSSMHLILLRGERSRAFNQWHMRLIHCVYLTNARLITSARLIQWSH